MGFRFVCFCRLIIEQSAVIVPFPVYHILPCVFQKLFKATVKYFGSAFLYLYRIDPHPLIQRRKIDKVMPSYAIGLQCRQNIAVDRKPRRRHIGPYRPPAIGHQTQLLHSAATFFIQLRPHRSFLARRQFLRRNAAIQPFGRAVDPPETQCLFHCVDIPKRIVVLRASAFYHDPALFFFFVVFRKPLPQLFAAFCVQYIALLHDFIVCPFLDEEVIP